MAYFENFISYRHATMMEQAKKLHDRLALLGHSVFWDLESLHAGTFDDAIAAAIDSCENFIALTNYASLSACCSEGDWVRQEISRALMARKNIILLFVGERIRFPESLPEELLPLKRYNGMEFFDPDSDRDMDELVSRFLSSSHVLSRAGDFDVHEGVLSSYRGQAPIVEIPEGVRCIGKGAFIDRTDIQEIHFPEGIISIEDSAFERCRAIQTIALPASLERIGDAAFRRCTALRFVLFGQGLRSIGDRAFEFCSALGAVELKDRLDEFAPTSFNNCPSLRSIEVSSGNRWFSSADGILYSHDKTEVVRCPEGKTSVQLPETVSVFADYSFYKSSIKEIDIPGEISSIGASAFRQSRLQAVRYHGGNPKIGSFAFADCSALEHNPFEDMGQKMEHHLAARDIKSALVTFEYVMVTTTFESSEDADSMVSLLLEKKLIVAGQIKPIRSVYMWNDEVCNEPEVELLCITEGCLYGEVENFIVKNHPYEVPQVICVPIINTTSDYGNWITDYVMKRDD